MPKTSLIIGFSVFALVLVLAGLWASGGLYGGRAEKRDLARVEDLFELEALTFCLAETAEGELPEGIDLSNTCQRDISLTDPFTDNPYTYERISDRAYKWCASFERPERINIYGANSLDPDTGCIQFTYRP